MGFPVHYVSLHFFKAYRLHRAASTTNPCSLMQTQARAEISGLSDWHGLEGLSLLDLFFFAAYKPYLFEPLLANPYGSFPKIGDPNIVP